MNDKEKALALSALVGILAACMSMAEDMAQDDELALTPAEKAALKTLQEAGLRAAEKLAERSRMLVGLPVAS
jgi:hypothetical protein